MVHGQLFCRIKPDGICNAQLAVLIGAQAIEELRIVAVDLLQADLAAPQYGFELIERVFRRALAVIPNAR